MVSRQNQISRSITSALLAPARKGRSSVVGRILAFFSLLSMPLARFEEELFTQLRDECWQIDQDEYHDAFAGAHKYGSSSDGSSSHHLESVGDLGYSGSVFFATPDGKFLIKSLSRHFEYDHFERDMLRPYAAHMRAHAAESLLVRITDYLVSAAGGNVREVPTTTLGAVLGLTPSRYMVMENLLGGKAGDPQRSGEWESYDLKPEDYFFPERDIADGRLAPDSVKDKLIDTFDDKIRITKSEFAELKGILESDTALLEATNCVDYSLFLVRYPADLTRCEPVRSNRNHWREGLRSSDGKWRYRIILLDFFFAKHRFQPQVMTGLVNFFNIFGHKGPMTITTTPTEYRTRFLRMIDGLVEVNGD